MNRRIRLRVKPVFNHNLSNLTFQIDLKNKPFVSRISQPLSLESKSHRFRIKDPKPWHAVYKFILMVNSEKLILKCGTNEDIPTIHTTLSVKNSPSNIKDRNQGLLTRSHAKKLQEQVNSFLTDCAFMTSKDVILPKCSTLVVLRCTHEEKSTRSDQREHQIRSDRQIEPMLLKRRENVVFMTFT